MDKGLYTGVLLLDLQKAFDTVNHEILLHKLEAMGLDHGSLKWFSSYLTNRKQFTVIQDSNSSLQSTLCGVPQGHMQKSGLTDPWIFLNPRLRSTGLVD